MRRLRRPFPTSHYQHIGRRAMMSGTSLLNNNCNTNMNETSLDTSNDPPTLMDEDSTQSAVTVLNMLDNRQLEPGINTLSSRNLSNVLEAYGEDEEEVSKLGRILRSVREVISCCACYSSDTIMKECTNGHLICQNCFLTLRQDERPQCPTCRANLYSDSRRALVAQKVLAELPDTCSDCSTQMLHKSLPNHRLNSCPKRRVACGLSALGCEWNGSADGYEDHYNDCNVRKQLASQPLGTNIDWLINRFKKREQTVRETFHCFSNVLRHLEAHEIQTVTVHLANVSATEGALHYRSDHFHINQSRWTAEIHFTWSEANLTSPANENPDDETNSESQGHDLSCDPSHESDNPETPNQNFGECTGLLQPVIRRRRWHQGPSTRHHPYHVPTSNVPGINPIQTGARVSVPVTQETPNPVAASPVNTTSDLNHLGEISYRMLKENSPGLGRRSYAFVLLQIRIPDTGVQIYARPQLQTYRYSSRGDHSSNFTVHPLRWRYLNSLKELSKYRLIQAEFIIARKLVDDHADN